MSPLDECPAKKAASKAAADNVVSAVKLTVDNVLSAVRPDCGFPPANEFRGGLMPTLNVP
jgi:hypothetical protein